MVTLRTPISAGPKNGAQPSGCVERCHAAGAVGSNATNNADLGHAKDPHNVHLAASALADQLGGKHPERAAVTLGVLKYGIHAAEVCPLAILAYDTD